jgi:hypothetical protein
LWLGSPIRSNSCQGAVAMAWNRGGPFHFRAFHISGQTRKNMKKTKCLRKQDIDFDCMHVHFHRYNTKYYILILYTILYHIIQYHFLLPACIPTKLQAYIDNHKYMRLQLPRTFSYIYVYTCTCLLNIYVYVCIYTCTHTLAQTCLIELWCGMHQACKNAPLNPDQGGRKIEIGSWPFPVEFQINVK